MKLALDNACCTICQFSDLKAAVVMGFCSLTQEKIRKASCWDGKSFVGLIPADEFVTAFLPADPNTDEGMPIAKHAFGSVSSNGVHEKKGIANVVVSRLVDKIAPTII